MNKKLSEWMIFIGVILNFIGLAVAENIGIEWLGYCIIGLGWILIIIMLIIVIKQKKKQKKNRDKLDEMLSKENMKGGFL